MPSTKIIFLTGYRATGKTTVGKLIAAAQSGRCIDTDDCVESAAGQSIAEIFASDGEQKFRDLETDWLRRVVESAEDAAAGEGMTVVSLGGGAILRPQNRELIREAGPCVWLTASASTLAKRLSADQSTATRRPSLTELPAEQEIATVLAERLPLYREAADFEIATDEKTPDQLAASILRWLAKTES
ncbi:MAG: shikimate kinase [Planctomycetota bacterium]